MENTEFDSIVRAVREFVDREVIPREDEIEETDSIPTILQDKAKDLGLFGYALPEEYGGLGCTMVEQSRLAFELGRTAPGFRSLFGTNNGIAGQTIAGHGTAHQKSRWLPDLASGRVLASFALTEAEAGSDPSGMRTRARLEDDHYIISGSKRYITNAALAGLFIVFAKTDPDAPGTRGISAFLVEADTPGLSVGKPDQKMGQKGAWTSELYFDNVRVHRTALVGGEEALGFRAAMGSLAKGRLTIGALCVGMASRVIAEMTQYATSSKQGGEAIGEFQLVQAMLAESETDARAGQALVLAVSDAYDNGTDTRQGPACAKLFCSEMVGRVVDRGVQVFGGMGYMRSVPVERFYRDARLYRIYEGTSEIQKLVIARQMLADQRSRNSA
ncbi:acyl-CoA dehydrogenase [Rhodococcus sp. 15-725-2-2b]|uniref:acyl-CoA dehydrogenase family protein n=1 Tax=unclassified Rhodococcus (in: high G+C Gram-positive bacteria) TaxID=192944 RepID=UPI000B9C3C3C|nr:MULTISPECIES: acyl-CoA dehydrogenase family protein [unclassified Rhodococcus (in: high G+C Gram-positive bacteria)]OZC63600.1 acyl-CoA dehydrogenase [Rhodococcus sp. 06-469-3-2]OZD40765.1 acyl-CoA dehydrogenase [Rhodococcus sp. 06-1477-1A]OZE67127.1 acyl-CoA dehydrogenase [Rhodococcus sp. 15-725-2-2b]